MKKKPQKTRYTYHQKAGAVRLYRAVRGRKLEFWCITHWADSALRSVANLKAQSEYLGPLTKASAANLEPRAFM